MSLSLHEKVERLETRVAQLEGIAERPMPPSIRRVVRQVAAHFGRTEVELLGQARAQDIVLARHIAMHLSRELHGLSLPRIGRAFGRDHTSVQHAIRRIQGLTASHPQLAAQVAALAEAITNHHPEKEG